MGHVGLDDHLYYSFATYGTNTWGAWQEIERSGNISSGPSCLSDLVDEILCAVDYSSDGYIDYGEFLRSSNGRNWSGAEASGSGGRTNGSAPAIVNDPGPIPFRVNIAGTDFRSWEEVAYDPLAKSE